MDKVVVGIDPSSKKVAISIAVPGEPVVFEIIWLPGTSMPKKCLRAYARLLTRLKRHKEHGEVFVFMEAPLVGRGGVVTTLLQTRVNGSLQAACARAGVEIEEVNVGTWKKHVVGMGNAKKEAVGDWLFHTKPFLHRQVDGDQDLIDAYAIMEYGKLVIKERVNGTQ